MSSTSLEGKTCLITGATRGIGEATARLFAESGAQVIATGRDSERGESLQRLATSGRIRFRRADLSSRDEVLSFFEWYDNEFSKVDVLINNARFDVRGGILETDLKDWENELMVNLTSSFLFSQWAAKNMIRNRVRGKIINISAVQAELPLEGGFAYSVTKGGLVSMVKSLAVDLGRYGIQAIAVLPGPIYTSVEGADSEEPPPSLDARAATLLGRFGRKSEVAKLLAFLSSDDNSFITGSAITIDGGRIISRKPDPDEGTSAELPPR
jgi:glucose 1-dehydrogenase